MKKKLSILYILFLFMAVSVVYPCTSVVVGKKASTDGSVLFGHNEDDSGRRIINVWRVPGMSYDEGEVVYLRGGGQIPQVRETWSFIWFQCNDLEFSDYYLNEWGVAVGSDACTSREDRPEIANGGIGYFLRRIVAERARSAREGVEIAGALLDEFGYTSSGRTLVICDPEEAWLLSIVAGKHWAARRVPDNGVVILPNTYVIREIDFSDSGNFITSRSNVRDYAEQRGWYDPQKGKPFDFAYAYMSVPGSDSKFVRRGYDTRQWRGQQMVTGDSVAVAEARERGLPFSVKPNRKLSVRDVMTILRDHYEGTQYSPATIEEPVFQIPEGECAVCQALPRRIVVNPNNTTERTICTMTTVHSTVAQLRSELPPETGCVLWTSFGRPDCNVFVPWYPGIQEIPEAFNNTPGIHDPFLALAHQFDPVAGTFEYDSEAAFWIFNDLENLIDAHYPKAIEVVTPVWEKMENHVFSIQDTIEKTAMDLWKKNPDQSKLFLTQHTQNLIQESLRKASHLTEDLKTWFYQ